MRDPNWLLSTTAQSAAALVAIIGGFLVSRLVSISSSNEGLRHRLRELNDRIGIVDEVHNQHYQRRLEEDREWFFDVAVDDAIAAADSVVIDDLAAEYVTRAGNEIESAVYAAELVRTVAEATNAVLQIRKQTHGTLKGLSALEDAGFEVPEERCLRDVYQRVFDKFATVGSFLQHTFQLASLRPMELVALDSQLYNDLVAREAATAAELRVLLSERDVARLQLERVGRPEGVLGAFVILSLFSLGSIVFPLIVLAVHPRTVHAGVRVAVVALFVAGLGALLIYMALLAQKLTGPTSD